MQVDNAFTWGPTSLGEGIFCLLGHITQLESDPRGLDLPTPARTYVTYSVCQQEVRSFHVSFEYSNQGKRS